MVSSKSENLGARCLQPCFYSFSSKLSSQDIGTTARWDISLLGHQPIGTSACWDISLLRHQPIGTSACCDISPLGHQPAGTSVHSYVGTSVRSDVGTSARWDISPLGHQHIGTLSTCWDIGFYHLLINRRSDDHF